MNAAVCVMVTVPTEKEELRQLQLHTKRCARCSNWEMGAHGHLQQVANGTRATATTTSSATTKAKFQPHNSRALQLNELQANAPLEQVVRRIAIQLRLDHVFWSHDVSGGQLQARFDLLQDERYERLLCTLQDWGIGDRPGTHVTAINCLETRVKLSPAAAEDARAATSASAGDDYNQNEGQRVGWQSFMDSVRCRLNVNQVVRVVRRDATINFDFVVLLMAAALLSCVGLVENSFLFLSSSMLISPLMGPIIAGIFGSVIGDRGLCWMGIRNELIGIAISVLTGFIFGGAICLCGWGRFFELSGGFTEEMISRCDTHSLAIGICTALASGAAAAIGVLGGNTGSLVGVAISASLLPPAVNAGLLWAIALCAHLLQLDQELIQNLSKRRSYSQQLHVELFVCATVSMSLTLLNIVCVWVMGVVVLRIKEVAPAVQRDQQFWRHDVRLAREVAQRDPQLHCAIDQLDLDERRQVDLEVPHCQYTWSPGMARPLPLPQPQLQPSSQQQRLEAPACLENASQRCPVSDYHTVHGFQNFCLTLHKLNPQLPRATSPPPLPSFMEVFTPLEFSGAVNQNAHDSGMSNYHRSLPDLRSAIELQEQEQDNELEQKLEQELKLKLDLAGEVKSKAKISRCVHWNVERGQQSLEGVKCHSGQVLLPLPQPNRSLQLLRSRSNVGSDESDNEREFNV